MHCCRNCRFYDPAYHNQCREPQAERQVDKERGNFCEYFDPRRRRRRPITGERGGGAGPAERPVPGARGAVNGAGRWIVPLVPVRGGGGGLPRRRRHAAGRRRALRRRALRAHRPEAAKQYCVGLAREKIENEQKLVGDQKIDASTRQPRVSYRLQEKREEGDDRFSFVFEGDIRPDGADAFTRRWLVSTRREPNGHVEGVELPGVRLTGGGTMSDAIPVTAGLFDLSPGGGHLIGGHCASCERFHFPRGGLSLLLGCGLRGAGCSAIAARCVCSPPCAIARRATAARSRSGSAWSSCPKACGSSAAWREADVGRLRFGHADASRLRSAAHRRGGRQVVTYAFHPAEDGR